MVVFILLPRCQASVRLPRPHLWGQSRVSSLGGTPRKQPADWPPDAVPAHKPQNGHILDRQCPDTPAPAAVESRGPGATHGERLRCMCGGLDVLRGAAGCAALGSALLPAPGVRPQSRRGAEGAERPAPSQAPAGGAPGHSARSSGRPLLEPPRDRPEVRAWMLRDQQVPSSLPALFLTCCATWSKST